VVSGTLYNPAVEQRVVVWHSHAFNIDEINGMLNDGWQVVSVTGAGGGNDAVFFFVVLERRRS
jgi:hypothetical protein